MSCTLNSTPIENGTVEEISKEEYGQGTTIKVRGNFTTSQLTACCKSCFSGSTINCTSGNKNYSGTCARVCCVSCGSVVIIDCDNMGDN